MSATGHTQNSQRRPFRVLMLTPDIGSLDRRIAQEGGTLARQGHEVDIYPVFDSLTESAAGLPPGVRMLIRPDTTTGRRVNAYLRGRLLKRQLRRVSRRLHLWVHIAQVLLIDTARLATTEAEANLLAGERYDLVFAHDLLMLPLAMGLRRQWGSRVICDLHEIYPEQHEIREEWWTYRALMRLQATHLPRADGILCVNPAIRGYVERNIVTTAPMEIVYNSVPYTPRLAPSSRIHELFGIDTKSRVLVFAGSLRSDANLDLLIRAFVEARVEGWTLALLGSGPEEDGVRRIVDGLQAGGRVFYGQRVRQHELISVLASADAGVVPYVGTDYNHLIATPNKLFEYVQARLPIVSAPLPEVARILTGIENGITLEFSNASALAAGLRSFLGDEISKVSSDALEMAAHRICWEQDEKALTAVVDAVLEGGRTGTTAKSSG